MAPVRSVRVCVAVSAFVVGAVLWPASAGEVRSGGISERIDLLFEGFSGAAAPGVAVGVVRGGERVHVAGYGLADLASGAPFTPETAVEVGALAMPFMAAAVLILAERGELGLDDPARVHVPPLEKRYGRGLTVRHLLSHTSGLPDYYPVRDKLLPKVKIKSRFGHEVKRLTMAKNADVAAAYFGWGEYRFAPGTAFEFSAPGYELLGCAIESASGVELAEFLTDSLFEPLGMTRSFARDRAARVVSNQARLYRAADGGFVPNDYRRLQFVVGGHGILTTVEDLLRWDRELAAPTLLRPGTLEEAVRPATLESGEEIAYGLGFRLGRYRGHDRVYHDAHDVGGHAAFVRHPGLGLTVVVVSNRDDCEAMRLADLVVDVCLETPTRGGH